MPADSQRLRGRLGLFVAGSLAALAGLVLLFGGAPRVFSDRTRYVVTFPEAPNIGPGTPVRKAGVRIGDVTALDLDEDSGQVRLTVDVQSKYAPKQHEEPILTRGLLNGDTAVDFVPKATVAQKMDVYPPGSVIPGVPPITPRELLNQASEAIPDARLALARLSASLQKLEKVAPKAEQALDEITGFARAARDFVPELRQTNTKVQNLIGADDPKPATLKDVLTELRDLLKDAGPEAKGALRSVRVAADNVNSLLTDDNKRAVSATLKNLQAGSDDLTKTIRLAAILLGSADDAVRNINARLTQAERVLANLEAAVKPLGEKAPAIVDDIAATVKDARTTVANVGSAAATLDRTLADVQAAVKSATQADGTLKKLLTDPALYNSLTDATTSLTRSLLRAEKIARDLEVFADKIARHPESLGVRGAVRPDSGLKEAPTAPLPPDPVPPLPPARDGGIAPIPPVPAYRPDLPPRR